MYKTMMGAAIAAVTASAALAELNADTEGTLKIFMRDSPDFVVAADATIAKFKELYPNVTLDIRYNTPAGDWAGYTNKYLNQVAAGDAPDVVETAIEGFEMIASTGLLADLAPLIEDSTELSSVVADIDPNLLNAMKSRSTGELNYYPLQWNNVVIYYNIDLFDAAGLEYPQAGWTWEEFAETAKALTVRDDSGAVKQWGYMIPGNQNFVLSPWFFSNNTDKLTEDWTASNAKDPAFAESMEFLHSLIHDHKVSPTYEERLGTEEFIAGQVAMFSCGHWCVPALRDAGLNAGIAMPPVAKEGMDPVTVFGIGGLGVLKESPNMELALEWLRLFAGDDFQRTASENLFSIPATKKWATTEAYLAFPANAEIYYDSASRVRSVTAPSNFRQVEDIFLRHLADYMTGNAELEDAVSSMDSELTRAMRRTR